MDVLLIAFPCTDGFGFAYRVTLAAESYALLAAEQAAHVRHEIRVPLRKDQGIYDLPITLCVEALTGKRSGVHYRLQDADTGLIVAEGAFG